MRSTTRPRSSSGVDLPRNDAAGRQRRPPGADLHRRPPAQLPGRSGLPDAVRRAAAVGDQPAKGRRRPASRRAAWRSRPSSAPAAASGPTTGRRRWQAGSCRERHSKRSEARRGRRVCNSPVGGSRRALRYGRPIEQRPSMRSQSPRRAVPAAPGAPCCRNAAARKEIDVQPHPESRRCALPLPARALAARASGADRAARGDRAGSRTPACRSRPSRASSWRCWSG